MPTYALYRLKIVRSEERRLFQKNTEEPGSSILSAIQERPSLEIRRALWRIGNIDTTEPNTVCLAVGKITRKTSELYDESRGEFVNVPLDMALHTSVAIDLHLQVCAIAPKSTIGRQVRNIASNLERMLNASQRALTGRLEFKLSQLNEPAEFIELIRGASLVTSFHMTFGPPNPWDVDDQFHRPIERFAQEAGATSGKISVTGTDLSRETLVTLSQSAASSGEKVSANIQSEEESKPSIRRLSGNQATVEVTDTTTIFDQIRAAYRRIRGSK